MRTNCLKRYATNPKHLCSLSKRRNILWHSRYRHFLTTTTRWSRRSIHRRCSCIMTSITLFRRHSSMTQPTTSLTKFKDCLRVPPTLHPQQMDDQRYSLRVQMRPAQIQLHSDLPPSEVWTYEGSLPGPIIEVARGQRVQIEWINALPADQPYPITAVTAPDGTQNEPGRSGRPANATVASLQPWTVVHLHGGRTAAVSDGWTENASLSGQVTTSDYANDQQATLLWDHDHAMGITRFNVYAGLAGLYLIRDAEEEALGLPAGPYEIPLLLQDRNLETAPDGSLTGRLLHKVEDNTMELSSTLCSRRPVSEPSGAVSRLRSCSSKGIS